MAQSIFARCRVGCQFCRAVDDIAAKALRDTGDLFVIGRNCQIIYVGRLLAFFYGPLDKRLSTVLAQVFPWDAL